MDQAWALSELRIDTSKSVPAGIKEVDDLINACGEVRVKNEEVEFKLNESCIDEWQKEEYND